jgi:hypothetical protein
MNQSPDLERAEWVDLGLEWEGGAPMPSLLLFPGQTLLLCYLRYPRPSHGKDNVGVLSLRKCTDLKWGPGQEQWPSHPLWSKGINQGGQAFLVRNSGWIEEYKGQLSVHPYADSEWWVNLNHYVLLFHDEMLEFLATEISVRTFLSTHMKDVMHLLADEFCDY